MELRSFAFVSCLEPQIPKINCHGCLGRMQHIKKHDKKISQFLIKARASLIFAWEWDDLESRRIGPVTRGEYLSKRKNLLSQFLNEKRDLLLFTIESSWTKESNIYQVCWGRMLPLPKEKGYEISQFLLETELPSFQVIWGGCAVVGSSGTLTGRPKQITYSSFIEDKLQSWIFWVFLHL